MARRTFLLSEVNLTEESVNLGVSGNLAVTGTSTFTGVSSFGNGTQSAPSIAFIDEQGMGFYRAAEDITAFAVNGGTPVALSGSFRIGSSFGITWVDNANAASGTADTVLVRDSANILAMKNGTTAQTQRWYGTTTNSQYVQITHDGTNGIITTSGGSFGFGTLTTSAATNVNGITGYISIVDSTGNARRLAVVT